MRVASAEILHTFYGFTQLKERKNRGVLFEQDDMAVRLLPLKRAVPSHYVQGGWLEWISVRQRTESSSFD